MPAASDLIAYAAANMPDIDTGSAGGAIDATRRVVFTNLASDGLVEVLSDGADTRTITVEGRNAAGAYVSEGIVLNGTTPVSGAITFSRILKVEAGASSGTRIATVRRAADDALIGTIPLNEVGFMALFRKAASDPSATKDYYMKFFWKNVHGSQALTTAAVTQATGGDTVGKITHTLANAKGDSATSTNRLTVPAVGDTNPDTFDDTSKSVPTGDLGAGEAIGVWAKLSLSAGDIAYKQTYTSEITGQSV